MTSKSLSLSGEQTIKYEPFLLTPRGKDYLWGGRRLNDDFAKEIDMRPLAETWECSTHPDGVSTIASGVFCGQLLSDVLKENPQFLGSNPRTVGELPILVKLIDADKDLSVQVHPSDEYAKEHENGQLGKTEMWYVLDAAKNARLVYGLRNTTKKETIRESILAGNLEGYLQRVSVKEQDVFFIEPGTIHAIGAGCLVAEIQESSNLTYRLYDYDRVDKHGKKRELHIEKALEVANLKGMAEPKQPMRVLKYQTGCATELLCRCKYFQVERMLVNTERLRALVSYRSDELSFRVLLCVKGCGTLFFNEQTIRFFRGDCIFVPANSVEIKIHGKAQFLNVSC